MVLIQLALFVIVVQIIFRPIMAAYLFTRPPRLRVTFTTPKDWGMDYEGVQFSGGGGVTLDGWYIPSRNGAAVVLLHGHSGNRLAVAYHAEALSRAGYGVLLFDLRAHGNSGGRRFARGAEAIEDVLAAVAFVARRREVQGRIGVMGVSVGGMLAIQAAARTTAVRALAVDGPILGTIDDLPPPEGALDRLWRYPQEKYYQAAIDWFSRSPRPPANILALARLNRRPVLFISTGRGMERRMTATLYEAAGNPREWWEIPHARHASGWAAEPEAYAEHMVRFFDRALSSNGGSREAAEEVTLSTGAIEGDVSLSSQPAADAPGELRPSEERTMPPSTAMMIGFATIPLAMLLLFIPYQLRWRLFAPRLPAGQEVIALLGLLVLLMAGLLVHEGVHLAGYRLFGRVPARVARFSFGRAALMPQVSCDQPVRAADFRRILLLPALVLGLLPGLIAVIAGQWALLIWSVWMLVAAAGDFAALWAMRGVPEDALVQAHPRRAGCLIYSRPQSVQNIDKNTK